ncbi:hypothetical protein MTO96_018255 [Rhipicephalus appendiculatus]
MIRACVFLALATCAFAGYAGYPFGYSVAAPAYAGAYHAPLASVSAVHHAPAFGYGLGYGLGLRSTLLWLRTGQLWSELRIRSRWSRLQHTSSQRNFRTCLVLALATCAFAGHIGYPYTYSVAAPTYAAYHAPIATAVSTVHHTPAFTYGYGYPAFNYGLGTYGLSYGYGLGGLGYTTLLKKCEHV